MRVVIAVLFAVAAFLTVAAAGNSEFTSAVFLTRSGVRLKVGSRPRKWQQSAYFGILLLAVSTPNSQRLPKINSCIAGQEVSFITQGFSILPLSLRSVFTCLFCSQSIKKCPCNFIDCHLRLLFLFSILNYIPFTINALFSTRISRIFKSF